MATTHRLAQILRNLEHCTSTSEKMQIIQDNGDTLPAFKELLQYALDPYKKYGFKVLPAPKPLEGRHAMVADPNRWDYLKTQLDGMARKDLTGNAAKEAMAHLLHRLDAPTRLVFQRIVLKDLRCGVGATLVNKVFPGLVPEFGIMLATPLEEKHLKKLQAKKKIYMQAKKNGDRCVVMVNASPAAYSRKGHQQHNYQHIVDACVELCNIVGQDLVFDGEVINGDFWGTRSVKKKAGNNADGAIYHIFDVIPLDQWNQGVTAPYGERRSTLKRIMHRCPEDFPLKRVPSHPIAGTAATWEELQQWRGTFMELGEEGLIIRLDEPYNFKTRSSLFKFKQMIEEDFMILEIREGEEGKKYEGMAAKILVDLGNGESCEVGLKGDIAYREHLWNNRNKYVGLMCEVHYQEKTKNQQGTEELQFGVMHRIREDKS